MGFIRKIVDQIEKIRFIKLWNFSIMKPNLENIFKSPKRRQILKTGLSFVTGLTTTSVLSFLIPKSTKKSMSNCCATTK